MTRTMISYVGSNSISITLFVTALLLVHPSKRANSIIILTRAVHRTSYSNILSSDSVFDIHRMLSNLHNQKRGMLLCLMLTSLLFKSYLSYQPNARITIVRSDMKRRLPGFALLSTPSATLLHSSIVDGIPVEILDMLHDKYKGPGGLQALLPELFSACRMIGTALREGIFTADKTGTENPFGDQQLDVDVRADKVE